MDAGHFRCETCEREWAEELPPLWSDLWPVCCHRLSKLMYVLAAIAGMVFLLVGVGGCGSAYV